MADFDNWKVEVDGDDPSTWPVVEDGDTQPQAKATTMTPERAALIKENERQAAIAEAERLGSDITRFDPQAIAEGVRTAYESAIPFGRKISAGLEAIVPEGDKPIKQRYEEAFARREAEAEKNPLAEMGGSAASLLYGGAALGKAIPAAKSVPGMALQAGLEGSIGGMAGQALTESQRELTPESAERISEAGYDWKSVLPGAAVPVAAQAPRILRGIQSKVAAGQIQKTPELSKALEALPVEPSALPKELKTAAKAGESQAATRSKFAESKALEDINTRKNALKQEADTIAEEIRVAQEQGAPVKDKKQYLTQIKSQQADLDQQYKDLGLEGQSAVFEKESALREGEKLLPGARQRLEAAHQTLQKAASSKHSEIGNQIEDFLKNATAPTEHKNTIKLELKAKIEPILENKPLDQAAEYESLIDNVLDGYGDKVLTQGEKIEAIRRVKSELGAKGAFEEAGPIKRDPAMARAVRASLEDSQKAITPKEIRDLISSHEAVYDAQNLIKSMSKKGLSLDVKPGLEAAPGKAGSLAISPKFEAQAKKVLEPLAPEATREFAESAQQIANKGVDPKQIEALEEKIHNIQGQRLKLKKERNAIQADPEEVAHYDKLIATYDDRIKTLEGSKRDLEANVQRVAAEAETPEGRIAALDRQDRGISGSQYQSTLDILNEIEKEGIRLGRPLTDAEKLRIMQPKFERAGITIPKVSEQKLSFAEQYAPELAMGTEPSMVQDVAEVAGKVPPQLGVGARILKGAASAVKGGATPLDTLWNEAKTRAASMGRAERSMRITNPKTGEVISVPYTLGAMFNEAAKKEPK